MVVKMIEESFNEPFKTGPLVDQQGHYAIFDISMNRRCSNTSWNHLNTKAGQMSAANSGLLVDFPPGKNSELELRLYAQGLLEDFGGERERCRKLPYGRKRLF